MRCLFILSTNSKNLHGSDLVNIINFMILIDQYLFSLKQMNVYKLNQVYKYIDDYDLFTNLTIQLFTITTIYD